ncbi:MAG: type II toxin-antitoxin system VapC family toxin [Dehalococcoidia bacterium]|nr:type II toxin-antitoxin system VapC family toxin [Dehalococcoidia bacterium]
MTPKYLFDSNICMDLLRPHRRNVTLMTVVRDIAPEGLSMSVVTYGEVYDRVSCSRQPVQNLQRWREFLSPFDVIDVTAPIAEIWAELRGSLRRQGLTTPDNDLIIGATALHFDLEVLTLNVRHFQRIDGLRLMPLFER